MGRLGIGQKHQSILTISIPENTDVLRPCIANMGYFLKCIFPPEMREVECFPYF